MSLSAPDDCCFLSTPSPLLIDGVCCFPVCIRLPCSGFSFKSWRIVDGRELVGAEDAAKTRGIALGLRDTNTPNWKNVKISKSVNLLNDSTK